MIYWRGNFLTLRYFATHNTMDLRVFGQLFLFIVGREYGSLCSISSSRIALSFQTSARMTIATVQSQLVLVW